MLDIIMAYPDAIATLIGVLAAHFGASAYVATTATKVGKLYKFIEFLALVINKAKDK